MKVAAYMSIPRMATEEEFLKYFKRIKQNQNTEHPLHLKELTLLGQEMAQGIKELAGQV